MPWQLLIRARYQYQIDAHIASTVISTVGRPAPQGVAAKLSDAAAGAVRRGVHDREEVGDERRITFLDAVASWEDGDICPPWWRFPFPVPPRPRWADEVGDPVMYDAALRALDLVNAAGSPQLQESFGNVLQELAG